MSVTRHAQLMADRMDRRLGDLQDAVNEFPEYSEAIEGRVQAIADLLDEVRRQVSDLRDELGCNSPNRRLRSSGETKGDS